MTPPVLFLIFNRPDLVAQSFTQIRVAKPKQLFIAADGPRADRDGEDEACRKSREIINQVDWDCEVKTLFRDENLGCRDAVSLAITWFFNHVEEGVILEDDCVADASFFSFCSELLKHYRNDERVMCITGNNFQGGQKRGDTSYYFSIYNHCWGWASWRRAWALYDKQLSNLPELTEQRFLDGFQRSAAAKHWQNCFDLVRRGKIDSWGIVWTFTCWANSGLTAVPNSNLVKNIGFDERATHTTMNSLPNANLPTVPVSLPFVHPRAVVRNQLADRWTEDNHFQISEITTPTFLQRARGSMKRRSIAICARLKSART